MGRLSGKVALITGGASGMGAAAARLFVAEGARVLIGDLNPAGEALAQELGANAVFFRLDVADEGSWSEAVSRVEQAFGELNILANFAGVPGVAPLDTATVADCQKMFEVNQLGTFLGIQAVIGPMEKAGGGSIVNIASGAAFRAAPMMTFYSATKAAIRGMSRSAAAELALRAIRVNTIYPGVIDTPMVALNSKELNDVLIQMTPMRRFGQPAEIAEAALFLASDAASFVTGADLCVDGGGTL